MIAVVVVFLVVVSVINWNRVCSGGHCDCSCDCYHDSCYYHYLLLSLLLLLLILVQNLMI